LHFLILVLASCVFAQTATIAVVDFDARGISTIEAAALTDRLRNELVRLGSYDVLERAMMEKILSEQDFQLTGCVSSECLVDIGRLLGAKHMLGGSFTKIEGVYIISSRLVDVETGKILKVSDYDLEGSLTDILNYVIPAVAEELLETEIPRRSLSESSQTINDLQERLSKEQNEQNQIRIERESKPPAYAPQTANSITVIGQSFYYNGKKLSEWRLTGLILKSHDGRAIRYYLSGQFLTYSAVFLVASGLVYFVTGIVGGIALGEVNEDVAMMLGGGLAGLLVGTWAYKKGFDHLSKATARYNEVISKR